MATVSVDIKRKKLSLVSASTYELRRKRVLDVTGLEDSGLCCMAVVSDDIKSKRLMVWMSTYNR